MGVTEVTPSINKRRCPPWLVPYVNQIDFISKIRMTLMRPTTFNVRTGRSGLRIQPTHRLLKMSKRIVKFFASVAPGMDRSTRFKRTVHAFARYGHTPVQCWMFPAGAVKNLLKHPPIPPIIIIERTSWLRVHLFAGGLQRVFNDLKLKDAPE